MKWIPCSERLPELDVSVLVYFAHDFSSYMEVAALTEFGAYLRYQGEAAKLMWWSGEIPSDLDSVTHWMPLPEPPEEETK